MEEAVFEDHLEDDASRLFGQLAAIDARLGQTVQIVDLEAVDALERQYPGRACLPEDTRDVDVGIGGEVGSEAFSASAFFDVVEFGAQRLSELLG